MVSYCFRLEVLEQLSFELPFQAITVKSEQALQAVSDKK